MDIGYKAKLIKTSKNRAGSIGFGPVFMASLDEVRREHPDMKELLRLARGDLSVSPVASDRSGGWIQLSSSPALPVWTADPE